MDIRIHNNTAKTYKAVYIITLFKHRNNSIHNNTAKTEITVFTITNLEQKYKY